MAKNDKEQDFSIGCPNPFSVAEAVAGKRINWTKKKDVFDTMAECYGITKEGYLSDGSPLQNPFIDADENGNLRRLSDEEAEKRLADYLEKHARPEKKRRKKVLPDEGTAGIASEQALDTSNPSELTQADKRQRAVSVLLGKRSESKSNVASGKATKVMKDTCTNQAPEAAACSFEEVCDRIDPPEKNDGPHTPDGMIWDNKGYFFNEYADWRDINQNGIGDCYFLAALCSVAYVNPFLIQNTTGLRFRSSKPQASGTLGRPANGVVEHAVPWHSIDFYVPNSEDCESTQAWKDKKKQILHIVVSEEILINKSTGYNYGACGSKERHKSYEGRPNSVADWKMDPCWAAVYEKAYAKFLERTTTDYPNMFSGSAEDDKRGIESGVIRGGLPEYALREILHTEKVTTKKLSSLSVDEILNIARAASTHPTCCSIHQYSKAVWSKTGQQELIFYSEAGTDTYYRETLGLYIGHAYSLLGTMSFSGDNNQYLIIRNPHGMNLPQLKNNPKVFHKAWSYAYSTHLDNEFHNWNSVYRSISGSADPLTGGGVFLIEVAEFKRVFSTIVYYTGTMFENYY